MEEGVFQKTGSRISKEEDFFFFSLIWKHCIFQQKRKLHEREVKGRYFGNKRDAAYFPVRMSVVDARVCVC